MLLIYTRATCSDEGVLTKGRRKVRKRVGGAIEQRGYQCWIMQLLRKGVDVLRCFVPSSEVRCEGKVYLGGIGERGVICAEGIKRDAS